MAKPTYLKLSRREREVMDIIYQRGQATAAEVMAALTDPPTYSAVRAKLRVLEDKGYVAHFYDGPRYVYKPVIVREHAERTALNHVLQTFFEGSVEKTVTALLRYRKSEMTEAELNRLSKLIDETLQETKDQQS